jgi:hypothetical protein
MKITKKGAMFGLEPRALKKQFGELFLVRVQSVTPKEAHGSHIQTKRGAMFGLDARIALAIFGALSIISGAALFSAIEDSKVTRMMTDANELGKAAEAYILDTGSYPPKSVDYPGSSLHSDALLENTESLEGWSGPYINFEMCKYCGSDYFAYPMFDEQIYIGYYKADDWVDYGDRSCGDSDRCGLFVVFDGVPPDSIVYALETKVDGTTSPTATSLTGRLRYSRSNGNWIYYSINIPYDKHKN